MKLCPSSSFTRAVTVITLIIGLSACGGGSSTSSTTQSPTAPTAPTIATAVAGDSTVTLTFASSTSDGGSPISAFQASCSAASASTVMTSGVSSPIALTGLINGTTYTCSVSAVNAIGASPASAALTVTPAAATVVVSPGTSSVLCSYAGSFNGSYGISGNLIANYSWTCSGSTRTLSGSGLPNHSVGTFPNAGNPNAITAQNVTGTMTLNPVKGSASKTIGGVGGASVWALNSVKFDPATAGSCPSSMTTLANCNLAQGVDPWRIEALGHSSFNFGVDANNAHVQPSGAYHYHGMPEGLLSNAGATDANPKMVLVGWASDGFPVYARWCHSVAMDATSPLKKCVGSFSTDTVPDAGRPSTSLLPIGVFTSDWNYIAGSGDLDDCNGRTGVTPEFPNGIYYYMTTDTYPFMSRCVKGN
jgi:YHYH protein/Fibronectin type III domain